MIRSSEWVEVPHDPRLATDGRIHLDRLRDGTQDAFLELAALVTDWLPAAGEPAPDGPTLDR